MNQLTKSWEPWKPQSWKPWTVETAERPSIQGGPRHDRYKWSERTTPLSSVVTPVKPISKAIHKGYNSTYN